MILMRLMGGLGNQLFQYAAGRQLAERLRTRLFLDASWFEESGNPDTPRRYVLDQFNIRANIAGPEMLKQFGGSDFSLTGRLKTGLFSLGKKHKAKFYDYGFDEKFDEIIDNTYLKGYFQSEKYFVSMAAGIREELTFRDLGVYQQQARYKEIKETLSVSLHVRRGDYVSNAAHGVCSRDYYEKAILYLKEKTGSDIRLYVFSDDPLFARREMDIPGAVFVDNSKDPLQNIDLFLMSACKHQIMANSTYSWWAAWLNPSAEKIVLAPAWWTNVHQTKDISLGMKGMQIIT